MEGSLAGTDAWFHNPASRVSAHFGIGRDGTIIQWVDTNDRAWHAVEADDYSVGVELEGMSGEPATDAQLEQFGRIYAWLHHIEPDVELWLNRRPYTGHGLSWHGLGGFRWGNHPQCPGAPIVHQLDEILAIAEEITRRIEAQPIVDSPKVTTNTSPADTAEANTQPPTSQETPESKIPTDSELTPIAEEIIPSESSTESVSEMSEETNPGLTENGENSSTTPTQESNTVPTENTESIPENPYLLNDVTRFFGSPNG